MVFLFLLTVRALLLFTLLTVRVAKATEVFRKNLYY